MSAEQPTNPDEQAAQVAKQAVDDSQQDDNNSEYLEHYPNAVVDKVKAEYMAYAEKPYREEANTLSNMARKADSDPIVAGLNKERRIGVGGWEISHDEVPDYQDYLRNAQEDAELLADIAANEAGEAYDNLEQLTNEKRGSN